MTINARFTKDTGEMLLNALHYAATGAETERERQIAAQTFAVLAHAMHPERYPAQPMRWADEPMPEVEVEP